MTTELRERARLYEEDGQDDLTPYCPECGSEFACNCPFIWNRERAASFAEKVLREAAEILPEGHKSCCARFVGEAIRREFGL